MLSVHYHVPKRGATPVPVAMSGLVPDRTWAALIFFFASKRSPEWGHQMRHTAVRYSTESNNKPSLDSMMNVPARPSSELTHILPELW